MSERIRSAAPGYQQQTNKMPDLGPKKTLLVLVIVVGCFAVLWPKVFYPMLLGSAQQHMKPSDIDRMTGCCDVISDADVDTIKIMSELCSNIIQNDGEKPPSGKEIVSQCRAAVLKTCGIDISAVLQEQVRLGATVKQILEEIRSLNGSLCLKYNFGVSPWKLGVPHRVTVKTEIVKQERPSQLKAELVHPAFRERGRAIPSVQQQQQRAKTNPPPRIVEGRPGPIPGMRPPMGGAGHVVPPSTKGTSSMSVIMPIYTIGIVIFFTYTLMKLLFRKQPDHVGGSLYPPVEPDRDFRKDVFESERSQRIRDGVASKLGVSELDQLRRRLRETELAMERIVAQMAKVPLSTKDERTLANGNVSNGKAEPDHSSVKVLGMEMTASCEGGQKWTRPDSPVTPVPHPAPVPEEPPQEIYLEGALPAQSKLLVADSATETQKSEENSDPAVVLAGKMTLSVISLDSNEDEEQKKETTPEVVSVNGVDEVDESKYTTVSNATAAEKDISDEEQNTDDGGIDGEAVEEIQNEEAPILESKHLANNIDAREEIETVAREFIENELKAALDEVTPITQEVKNELKDIDELLYDQIRQEEEAELKAVLAQKQQDEEVTEETVPQEQNVDVFEQKQEVAVKYEEENVTSEQQSEIANEVEAEEEVAVEYEEEVAPNGQNSAITDEIEAKQEVAIEYEEETISREQKSEITNGSEAKQETADEYEEETIPSEQKSGIANDSEAKQETAVEYEEESIPSEQKTEIVNEIQAKQEVAVEYEEEAIPKEQNSDISNDTEAKEETAVVYEEELVSKEQTAAESTTEQKQQQINLDDFDPDEYEIEEYEVEVDEDEDVVDEVVIVDDDAVPRNVPKK